MHYRLSHPGQGVLGPSPAIYASQPTTLPNAFSTMPLQDPTWHMDTGASSHLIFNAGNLSTIFDKRLFPSVHVGDGKSIPVTNTGHNIIPSHHRPLHLHNVLDYFTRHILLRCDSSGDLYPVTKPSTSPIAFLSTSVSTLHQRLGHSGDQLLVPRPAGVNMVRSMWLFKHKFHADGTLSRYKARLVANGSSQQLGVDFDETFSPVVKPAIIRTVLSFVVSRKWPIHQLDVKNAFLNGDLSETVYMHQHPGFVDSRYPHHVCLLQRSLYGLKQAPRAWFQRFAGYATRAGFYHSRCDSSLFIYRQGSQVTYLLIYVDGIILTASSPDLLQHIIASLHNEFDMTDLGVLNYFLGIFVDRTSTVDTESKLGTEGVPVQDPTLYHSLADGASVSYIYTSRLSYAVQQICFCMHDPREPHFATLKRILRYVRGIVDFGFQLYVSTTTSLVAYTDADWAGCLSTRRSASSYCVFLGDNLFSWSAKRQHTLSRSSAEAEYRSVAKTAWLRNLLSELHSPLSTATLVYCDNVSAIYMSANPVQHQRTKHIKIDIHFVRDMVTAGQVRVLHVPSRYQYADIFTKGLPSALFEEFQSSLSVRPPLAPTAGAY
ncbi:ribonuclease H-like domain-containing protein [Tanacetum coccineum]